MRSLKLDSTPWYQHGAFRALDVKLSLANTSYLFTEIRSGRGGCRIQKFVYCGINGNSNSSLGGGSS